MLKDNILVVWLSLSVLLYLGTDGFRKSHEEGIRTMKECVDIQGVLLDTRPYMLCQKGGVIKFKVEDGDD